mmetsp:Transcript_2123/g.2347  ORF Transcript_2123/g.2347 Transcript_2123/m.2347 type:complete len:136 (+) Transcript_2123:218-625(+)
MGGEQFLLADPQCSPTIVCIKCGLVSKSYDTFTKRHRPFWPQKAGPKHTKDKEHILRRDGVTKQFYGDCRDYWYNASETEETRVWLASQKNSKAVREDWQQKFPQCAKLLKVDFKSLDSAALKVPATKVASTQPK